MEERTMTMKESNINKLIMQKVLGRITETEQKELDDWIARSRTNRLRYEKLMDATDTEQVLRTYDAIDGKKAWQSFRDAHFMGGESLRNRLVPIFLRYAVAAVAVALAVSGVMVYMQRPQPVVAQFTQEEKALIAKSGEEGRNSASVTMPNGKAMVLTPDIQQALSEGQPLPKEFFDNPEAEATVLTQKGQEFWMTLEDGTRVHLNNNTSLRYPEHFASDNRTVYLDGEAYFDVAHDQKRPFYVQTPNGTVREYGTSFSVNTFIHRGKTLVALVEGSISVTARDGREHMMRPGQLAIMSDATGGSTVETTDIDPYISWNEGEYQFDGCKLSKLMQVLSCWYNVDVEFRKPDVRNIEFTGSIDRYKSLQATLNAITYATGLEMSIVDERVVIY